MPSIDLPVEELRSYVPEASRPDDFDDFWARTMTEARQVPLAVELEPASPKLAGVTAYRACFGGIGGARISGWYLRPEGDGPFPGAVRYHGYGMRGDRPLELYTLAAQGVAVLSLDCRGQDGGSPDIPPLDGGHAPGWLTRGLRDPERHYYRYVYADVVRALDAVASFDEVDGDRLAVSGASQGGGLALAAAALSGRASFVWADIPFLCDFPRAVAIAPQSPCAEVAGFLRRHPDLEAAAYRTLSYFDIVNHAPAVTCPAVVTVGLWDDVCPPSTVFGMFARIGSADKELVVWPYHGHSEIPYDNDERRLVETLSRLGVVR
jgi:cephalosporin-C deacetylase